MTIGILNFSSPSHSSANEGLLEQAAVARGHEVVRLYEPTLPLELPELDVVIVRPNFIEEPSLRLYALRRFIEADIPLVNGDAAGIALCKNKIDQHFFFQDHQLPCPDWGLSRDPKQALEIACGLGFPVVMKTAFGTHGKGVFFAPSHEVFEPIADYLAIRDGNPIIVERFIGEAERSDLRVFVLNGTVVAAMERQAPIGDIRANTSTGGTGHQVTLTDAERDLAKRVADLTELDIVGVDIIRSQKGPLLLEINANPGFKELERVTEAGIADKIIALTEVRAQMNG